MDGNPLEPDHPWNGNVVDRGVASEFLTFRPGERPGTVAHEHLNQSVLENPAQVLLFSGGVSPQPIEAQPMSTYQLPALTDVEWRRISLVIPRPKAGPPPRHDREIVSAFATRKRLGARLSACRQVIQSLEASASGCSAGSSTVCCPQSSIRQNRPFSASTPTTGAPVRPVAIGEAIGDLVARRMTRLSPTCRGAEADMIF